MTRSLDSEALRRLLAAIADLTTTRGRPPSAAELSRATSVAKGNMARLISTGRRRGKIADEVWEPFARAPIRVTPLARREMGLPVLAYLAWPMPPPDAPDDAQQAAHDFGRELASMVLETVPGAAPVSPYLAPFYARSRARLDHAAAAMAAQADGVIVWRDRLLIGRADVVAASKTTAPIALVDRSVWCTDFDPWAGPYLVRFTSGGPSYPQERSQS